MWLIKWHIWHFWMDSLDLGCRSIRHLVVDCDWIHWMWMHRILKYYIEFDCMVLVFFDPEMTCHWVIHCLLRYRFANRNLYIHCVVLMVWLQIDKKFDMLLALYLFVDHAQRLEGIRKCDVTEEWEKVALTTVQAVCLYVRGAEEARTRGWTFFTITMFFLDTAQRDFWPNCALRQH